MKKPTAWQADLLLLAVAFIWGTTFIIVKKALLGITPFAFLGIRFILAFLCLLIFCRPRKELLNPQVLLPGLITGFCLFSGYALQTIGLQYTTASNAGFITGLSVVLVPLLAIVINKKRPSIHVVAGACSSATGLGLLSLRSLELQKGDLLVLLCAFGFALHIITVGYYVQIKKNKALHLATLQIGTAGLLSAILWLVVPGETWPVVWSADIWWALGLTAIPATSLAILIQNSVQKFTSPSRTAIVLSLEPVFAALTAWCLGGEYLTLRGMWGAFLILLGMLIVELKG